MSDVYDSGFDSEVMFNGTNADISMDADVERKKKLHGSDYWMLNDNVELTIPISHISGLDPVAKTMNVLVPRDLILWMAVEEM